MPARVSSLAPERPNPQARNTVTVACKLMHGLTIRLFRWEDYQEQSQFGEVKQARRAVEIAGTRVTIKGVNSLLSPEPRMPTSFAYALTTGVPEDIWSAWLAENKDADVVKNGLIFAAGSEERARDQGREQEAIRTGQEPIDQMAPQKRVSGIERGNKLAA